MASFLLKTMLQKRAATTIKESDGSPVEPQRVEEDELLAESLDLTNY